MTAIAEKLKNAGYDTLGPQLIAALIEGLKIHPTNNLRAWDYVFQVFGHALIGELKKDMRGGMVAKEHRSAEPPILTSDNKIKPYQPRIISHEVVDRRRKQAEAVRSKFKNSGGICWSEVSWHELHGLARDGKEAAALLAAGPANVPNDGRTVGDVLGVKRTDEIVGALRK